MKNIINNIAIILLLTLFSSCTKDEQVVQPKNTNGTGILRGGVTLMNPNGGDTRDINQSGAKVEVLGTNIVAYTTAQTKDVGGIFVLHGLDSGTYTLRVSKEGYAMMEMKGIYSNGVDSSDIEWNISDTNGTTKYKGVMLDIQAPILSINSSTAQISQIIRIDTVHIQGSSIVRDTSYPSEIGFAFAAETIFDWSREHYPIGYIAYVDNNSSPSAAYKPDAEYPNGTNNLDKFIKDKQLPGGIVKTRITPNSAQQIKYPSLKELAKLMGADLANREQLYVHIYPFAYQSYTSVITSKYDPPLLGGGGKWVVQNPIAIPIEWK